MKHASTTTTATAPTVTPALAFDGVSKRYSAAGAASTTALDDVSFTVPRAAIVGVIGASGAGKSTVFRCAAALERPDAGAIRLAGCDLGAVSGPALRELRKRVGLVFQQLHLAPSRTAQENIALPLELAGASRDFVASRTRELLGWVGLLDRAGSYPKNLSGGQRQRIAIARALAASPDLLLCDEPSSALDPATTRAVTDLLLRVRNELGVAVMIITHEMTVARSICDRVVALEAGRVVDDGPADEVLATRSRGGEPSRASGDLRPRREDVQPHGQDDALEVPSWMVSRH
ncbi:MAG: hypothetical protein BGO98_21400 [Myxococcales bacterium 68-20]|nr:MAG: hypothetical protein BGO98_21400 [Myxococcales bacterium 68-20]